MQDFLIYIILGIVQGVTEFLPISSSGHLVIFQHFLNVKDNVVLFDVLLHVGTLLAVIVYFFKDIIGFLRNKQLVILIIISAIPTFIIGFFLDHFSEKIFTSPKIAGIGLLITGIVLLIAKKYSNGTKASIEMKPKDAVLLGIAQGISVLPGISRSGATISTAFMRNVKPQDAFKFSFIMSIPVILGAVCYKSKDIITGNVSAESLGVFFIGAAVACVAGYISLWILSKFIARGKLHIFSWYCFIVGIVILTRLFQ